ncbi:MAG: PEP-CTERM sorting domain-containing protein [Phormidium sp.]
MKNTISTLLGSALLATGIASALVTAPANAFTLGSCSTSNVSGSVSCGVGEANQDSVNPKDPLTVNEEAFFGLSDWTFDGKIGTAGYTGTGDGSGKSGSWDISSVFQDTWNDVMLVFKSGNGTTLTGFLLEKGQTAGSWSSPFLQPGKDPKDVSHISVYYTSGGEQPPVSSVPEPATLMGLGLVASGMVMARRRKSS